MTRESSTESDGPSPALLDRATAGFAAQFGRAPSWTAAAPGRVNLIGEHVDYSGGLVLPIAIDRWAVAAAAPARGPDTTLAAIDLDRSVRVGADACAGELAALVAVVRRFAAFAGDASPFDVVVTSDVPRGAGLSSSAAVEVAVATVLGAAAGRRLDPREKALLCQGAEHDAGVPCGIMDMLVAASAEPGAGLLIDCESLDTQAVPLPPVARLSIVVVPSGVDRTLASTAYAERRATCARVAATLGVSSLRHADASALVTAIVDPVDRRRAMHVVTENERTRRAVDALARDDMAAFGDLLFASHDSLRDLYEVSCPELDTLVSAARDLREHGAGVYGARMTGAGFGGCAIVACTGEAVAEVEAHLRETFRLTYGRGVAPFVARAVGGSRAVPTPK